MDALTLGATVVGSIVGAGAASFTAVWKLLVVPARKEAEDSAFDQEKLEVIRVELQNFKSKIEGKRGVADREHAVLSERVEGLGRTLSEAKEQIERLQAKMSSFVTDEEWQAGQGQLQQSVNALTEKVGRTVGAIEAWQTRGSR